MTIPIILSFLATYLTILAPYVQLISLGLAMLVIAFSLKGAVLGAIGGAIGGVLAER